MTDQQRGRTSHPWTRAIFFGIMATLVFAIQRPVLAFLMFGISFIIAGLLFYPAETIEAIQSTITELELLVPTFSVADLMVFARSSAFFIFGSILFFGLTSTLIFLLAWRFDVFDLDDAEDVTNYDQ